MDKESIYILNPNYLLKPDRNRVFITNKGDDPIINNFMGFVHPVYAILLSLFDGEKNLSQVLTTAAGLLRKDINILENIILPLLENEDAIQFHYDERHFSFPARLLIKKENGYAAEKLNPEYFFIPQKDLDFETWRLNSPLDVLFMINTRCVTDCIYCYADRRINMDCEIAIERLQELIREAKSLQMRSFNITGGEFFLYKKWEILLAELLSNGFSPYISTKCPIDEEIIYKLKEIGLRKIQISIDSLINEELIKILHVNADYPVKLIETLKNLDKHGFEIFTNTQITNINQDNISQLLDFLLTLKNIKRINVGPASFSLYRGETKYREYKPRLEAIQQIKTKMEDLKKKYWESVSINFSGYSEKSGYIGKTSEEKKKNYDERSRCSANFYAFVILPDGKVTICEELYWHQEFIIGDINKQSIAEVWNSKMALDLYNISQNRIRNESECKTCAEFDRCHKYKGVCWKEIFYAYGDKNWDYPDPKCPFARRPNREFYLS